MSVVAFIVTQFGSEFIIAAIGVAVYVTSRDNKKLGLAIIVAIVMSDAALFLVKSSFFRPRPYQLLTNVNFPFGRDEGSSFPSGHTTRAFAFACLFPLLKGRKYSPAIVLAIFVGLTRVVLGVHFPFDTLGGALFGITIALVVVLLLDPIQKIISRKLMT
jgi:undecaprenyl-diphosphatase